MTKSEVLKQFKAEVLPAVVAKYGDDDRVAKAEAWNNYTDSLCKDRQITAKQYSNWTNPF